MRISPALRQQPLLLFSDLEYYGVVESHVPEERWRYMISVEAEDEYFSKM
jgi:hypothetical protein